MDQGAARAFDRDTQGEPVTKTVAQPVAKIERKENPIFIRSELDDYGLTPNEFRVLARISRRAGDLGACWESIPNMAQALELSANTVRRCCQVLALARLISELNREGETTERRVRPIVEWKNKAELPGIRKIVIGTTEKKRTPTIRDRGSRVAGSTLLPCEIGAPLPQQTGLPLPPEIDEGDPIESNPVEGDPKKEIQSKVIPHTQANDVEVIDGITVRPVVCVPIPFDLTEIRRQYAEAHSNLFCKQIKNPGGWLIAARDGRYDEVVMQWWREEQEKAERKKTIRERLDAEEAAHALQVEELRASRTEEDQEKAAEWERNAPERERQRLEELESERCANLATCKKLWKQFANNPTFRDRQIAAVFPNDEVSRAEWAEWLANGAK